VLDERLEDLHGSTGGTKQLKTTLNCRKSEIEKKWKTEPEGRERSVAAMWSGLTFRLFRGDIGSDVTNPKRPGSLAGCTTDQWMRPLPSSDRRRSQV
jgi:hypothetical protein